ncbi:ubiquitin carboxyl-terminal hydrolase MINDY-1 isoform X2, partial [Tanacetum coccineum]
MGNILSLQDKLGLELGVKDVSQVSQEKLLSLVANCLNKELQNEDQRINPFTASDLLHLATLITVNIGFNSIDDIVPEECDIFHLLKIPLYPGSIVDPQFGEIFNLFVHMCQDSDTFKAIGSKSYDELAIELATLKSLKDLPQTIAKPDDSSPSTADANELVSGEKCIRETSTLRNEGEAVTSEKLNKGCTGDDVRQGELIPDVLTSPLTVQGLFSLHEGLEERKLCVLFRNNHFDTMFKVESGLYLLVTDQGYSYESHVVWEKLTEVNGNTVFVDSDFKEMHDRHSWDQQNAMADTDDYNLNTDNVVTTSLDSYMQLPIQPRQQLPIQQQQQQPQQVSPTTSHSGLVAGPQFLYKQETASKSRQARDGKQESSSKSRQARVDKKETGGKQETAIDEKAENTVKECTNWKDKKKDKEQEALLISEDTAFVITGENIGPKPNPGNHNPLEKPAGPNDSYKTVILTVDSDFKEMHDRHSWDQQNAMADTDDYNLNTDNVVTTSLDSYMQLPIQPRQQLPIQRQQQQPQQVSPTTSHSGLVAGPQ